MKLNRLVPVTAAFSAALLFAYEPPYFSSQNYSKYSLLRSPRSVGSMPFTYKYVGREAVKDTVKVIAIRVAFQSDKDVNTTGNGRFGIWQTSDTNYSINDQKERDWYTTGGYSFDLLPHDSLYFARQLDYLKSYYKSVSNDNLSIDYSIFPSGSGENSAYLLPRKMALYSPGAKGDQETYVQYALRVDRLLMEFIRDALQYSNDGKTISKNGENPFSKIVMDSTGTLWEVDSKGNPTTKAVILLIHAGSSQLIDRNGDSRSDLTDNFITEDKFSMYTNPDKNIFGDKLDSINGRHGIQVTGYDGKKCVISEVMMIPETSNQDSLNYGTHGILVNQFARQIGIPDLYSRVEGVTGVGRFDIMDHEGYSSANGFIPPNPSAWTRLFMGWDQPSVVTEDSPFKLSAVGSSSGSTMAIVPINSHEYWLVENRQRNLTGDTTLFNYDTTDGITYIQNENSVNLSRAVDSVDSRSKVILIAKSQDIGIAGSGMAVWHIDESLISNRLAANFINSDPNMRGVALEEADGVVDIGAKYQSVFGTSYGNGTADDLFPHTMESRKVSGRDFRHEMTPVTSPSTIANDGGNSFIEMYFDSTKTRVREKYRMLRSADEKNKYADYFIYNYVDSVLSFTVKSSPAFSIVVDGNGPVRRTSSAPFDLMTADIAGTGSEQLIVLDSLGHLSVIKQDGSLITDSTHYSIVPSLREGIKDTIYYTDSIPSAFTFPTYAANSVIIPSKNGIITQFLSINMGTGITKNEIDCGVNLTSPVISLSGSNWAVGGEKGALIFGNGNSVETTFQLKDTGSVQALSYSGKNLAAVTSTGNLYVFNGKVVSSPLSLKSLVKAPLYPPFAMVSGDLDGDNLIEIAVTDSRQGLFLCQYDPSKGTVQPHPQTSFTQFANDWAGVYHEGTGRDKIPSNGAHPSLSDIDGDGSIEIIVPGTNGLYAFNSRGIMIPGWPALMDKNNWWMRRSIVTSPITLEDSKGSMLTLFATPTGDKRTYEVAKVLTTGPDNKEKGKFTAYFKTSDGYPDSITGYDSLNLYDTILKLNDSLIYPYVMPGGMIDARNSDGKRPDTSITTLTAGTKTFSPWPLTMGTPVHTSPVAITTPSGDTKLYAAANNGYLYAWNLSAGIVKKPVWNMTGGNAGRTFSLNGSALAGSGTPSVENFYTYPNPLRITDSTARLSFRYELGQKANSAKLSVYTAEGRMILDREVPIERGINEFLLTDLSIMGSAPYTCRLEVTFPSATDIKFWKMAVLRGHSK